MLDSPSRHESIAFWRTYFEDAPPLIDLLTDRHRTQENARDYSSGSVPVEIEPQTASAIETLSERHGLTTHTVLLTAWQILLARYSRSADVVVGSPVECSGSYDMLPIRVELPPVPQAGEKQDASSSVLSVLKAHHETKQRALTNRRPLREICAELGQDFCQSYTPLFQVLFSAEDVGARRVGWRFTGAQEGACTHDLELHINPISCSGQLSFRRCLFDELTVARLSSHFATLLANIAGVNGGSHTVDTPWYDIGICSDAETSTVVEGVNATSAPYPATKCIHDEFEDMAVDFPGRPCLTFHDDTLEWTTLTYGDVYCRCYAVMKQLQLLGVKPDVAVPIILERSMRQVIAIYGVLLAGGCYVPIDADYPEDRILHMLRDANASVVITDTALLGKVPKGFTGQRIEINRFEGEPIDIPAAAARRRQALNQSPDTNVYIFYTSGTTGLPKGVEVTHRGLVKRAQWLQDFYPITKDDKIIYKTPFTFGISEWELFWPMPYGAQVVICKEGGQKDPEYLVQVTKTQEVTLCTYVPSMLAMLIEYMSAEGLNYSTDMRHVICCGEALPVETCHKFFEVFDPDVTRLHNLYGPTEADMTYWECPKLYPGEDIQLTKIPIGKPMLNVKVYLLDARGHPVPAGVPGELHFGGVTTAKGYLNMPELTAEKFVKNPFRKIGDCERMYKTGDCARWLPDLSTLEFLGRVDNQVKLRGFRIELGEIESVIGSCEGITKVAVLVDGAGASARIIAYVEPKSTDVPSLMRLLKSKVPEYMVPSVILPLETLPLTSRGKLDRKALPKPPVGSTVEEPVGEATFVGASTPTERIVESVWKTILGREGEIDVHKNFLSLGGNSLLAGRVTTLVRKQTGSMIPSTAMYKHPTISKIAELCANYKPEDTGSSGPVIGGNKFKKWGGVSSTSPKVLFFHAIGMLAESYTSTAAFLPGFMYLFSVYYEQGKWAAFKLYPVVSIITVLAVLVYSIVLKKALIGTVRPGEYPIWGPYYLRWWLTNNLHKASVRLISPFAEETFLYNRYLMMMGAVIGDRVTINTDDVFDPDLISIEDDVAIERKATLIPHALENGILSLYPIHIGQHCRVQPVGWVTQGTRLRPGTEVGPLSTTGMSARNMKKGTRLWSGISNAQNYTRACLIPLIFVIEAIAILPAVYFLEHLWENGLTSYAADSNERYMLFCLCIPWVEKLLVAEVFFLITCAYKWLFIGRFKAGRVDSSFSMLLRKWILERLTHHNQYRFATQPWINTELLAMKYRMMGVKMGFKVQTDFVEVLEFDLLSVGRDSVFGSNVTVCPTDHIENRKVIMQNGAQVLDHSTIMPGCVVAKGALCGSSTVGPKFHKFPPLSISTGNQGGKPVQLRILDGDPNQTSSLGHLPPAEREMATLALRNHQNTARWAGFNIFNIATVLVIAPIPAIADVLTIVFWLYLEELAIFQADDPSSVLLSWAITVLITPPAYMVIQLLELLFFIVFKWVMVGKYREGSFPFYGSYHRKWVIMMVVKEAAGKLLDDIAGTAFYTMFFRAMGATIGDDVCMYGYGLEYDLFSCGSQSCVGTKCDVTCHTVENMVIKLAPTKLASNCTMRAGALVQPGGVVLDGAVIMENSQVLKGGEVGEDQVYAGLPAEPVQRVSPELAVESLDHVPSSFNRRGGIQTNPLVIVVCIFLLLWMLPTFDTAANAASRGDNKVRTSLGVVNGEVFSDSYGNVVGYHYAGIPYADPPVDEKRWMPPTQAAQWGHIRQSHRQIGCVDQAGGSEDCLYLDVTVPDREEGDRTVHPVVVWFPSGCGTWARPSGHDGRAILHGMGTAVVVTPSYRVGAMGLLHVPGVATNLALLDQRAVLRWVEKNIRAFGGDAKNVTLLGQGSSAQWPIAHMVSKGSWGLFNKVIVQSVPMHALVVRSAVAAAAQAAEVVENTACSGMVDGALLKCLREKRALDLHTAGMQISRCKEGKDSCSGAAYTTCGDRPCVYGLVVDGKEIPDQPWRLLQAGDHAPGVPVIIGYHSADGLDTMAGTIQAVESAESAVQWRAWAQEAFYPTKEGLLAEYYLSSM